MEDLIQALIENETASNREDAIEIINCMRQEVEDGEDIHDVLSQHDLDLDYAIDLLGI
jgi:type II secretory pathway component PulF